MDFLDVKIVGEKEMRIKHFLLENPTREQVLKKAKEYLKHEDEFVRILAQIALYHYGDK